MACNDGSLWLNYGLRWGIVAYSFRLLGVPGIDTYLDADVEVDVHVDMAVSIHWGLLSKGFRAPLK